MCWRTWGHGWKCSQPTKIMGGGETTHYLVDDGAIMFMGEHE
jgi:hypothetical protein